MACTIDLLPPFPHPIRSAVPSTSCLIDVSASPPAFTPHEHGQACSLRIARYLPHTPSAALPPSEERASPYLSRTPNDSSIMHHASNDISPGSPTYGSPTSPTGNRAPTTVHIHITGTITDRTSDPSICALLPKLFLNPVREIVGNLPRLFDAHCSAPLPPPQKKMKNDLLDYHVSL